MAKRLTVHAYVMLWAMHSRTSSIAMGAKRSGMSCRSSSYVSGLVQVSFVWLTMMSATGLASEEPQRCGLSVDSAVCYGDGTVALSAPALPKGLIGHWTFDEEGLQDMSGFEHHGFTEFLERGPPAMGVGQSAAFRNSFLTIDASSLQKLWRNQFSFTFWIFLADGGSSGDSNVSGARESLWCPIFRKAGFNEEFLGSSSGAPGLHMNIVPGLHMGRLRASLSVSGTMGSAHSVESHARLLPNRWTQMAVTYAGHSDPEGTGTLFVVVNGILDAQMDITGESLFDNAPIYVGGDPGAADGCDHTVYIDEFKIFDVALTLIDMQAESTFALGGASPGFAHLGCSSCFLRDAQTICPKTRHLCSSLELDTGGYQVATAMGWLYPGVRIWTSASYGEEGVGLALCCIDEVDDH